MLARTLPGVVSIAVQGELSDDDMAILRDPAVRRYFGLPRHQQPEERRWNAAGSGVVVDADRGYVITALHLLERADRITAVLGDGHRYGATLAAADPEADLAVLQVDAPGLAAVPVGNSDALRVGDYVVAVGNPFGLGQTATLGIVSALGRTEFGAEGYEDLIQTDASMNPGNSGGALVNLRGELVGLNSAILGPPGGNAGISFAVPINRAKVILARLAGRRRD